MLSLVKLAYRHHIHSTSYFSTTQIGTTWNKRFNQIQKIYRYTTQDGKRFRIHNYIACYLPPPPAWLSCRIGGIRLFAHLPWLPTTAPRVVCVSEWFTYTPSSALV
jgi:hypothetical protein